jgi:reversibly glycosylated polypeptide / UDP-arabinopyranose mutase
LNILVVPTIREDCIVKFLNLWSKFHFDEIIVIEDNPKRTFQLEGVNHFSWENIEADLGEDSWIISRRDSAIRSYGFYKAYQMGASNIFTLDDDCLPHDGNFIADHLNNLYSTKKWTESVTGFRTRGLPYKNLGTMTNVCFSMGLWTGVPDLDAINMLTNHTPDLILPKTRVASIGQYFPFCGMNFAFKQKMTPLTYFPLMGKDSPFGRFDDIWFGIICKKICDHLNIAITIGEPYVYHSKASNPFDNLIKEAPGIKFNEQFWEHIDCIQLYKTTPASCMAEIGSHLQVEKDDYLKKLGKAMIVWANLFPS